MTTRDDTTLLDADELLDVLRNHEGPPEPRANGASRAMSRRKRPRVHRAALLGVGLAAALLLGSSLGFGLGSSVTPSGSAGDNVVGYGFLPARNWSVLQSGAVGLGSAGHALAANVPLPNTARASSVPYEALAVLPPRGIIIATTFGLRGNPSEDVSFPARALPLRLADGTPLPATSVGLAPPSVRVFRIRAGVGGSNVDVRIYFGSDPTQRMSEAAQQQLERLVVASERVTIAARPAIAPPDKSVTLFGSIENGKAGETVEIQAKDCGQQFFRAVQGATTVEGGGWSLDYYPLISTTLRAVWDDAASSQITVRKRAMIHLTPRASTRGRFRVWIVAQTSLWRKRTLIQKRDQRLGTWITIRSVALTEQDSGGNAVSFSTTFRLAVPRGTLLRAVLPRQQAQPCYLSATSLPVRT